MQKGKSVRESLLAPQDVDVIDVPFSHIIVADEIKTADKFIRQGSFAQAYPRLQVALSLLSKSPTPMPLSLNRHVHLGMAECRISASDEKTRETALEYLDSALKHAVKAYDLADEASKPAAQMSLLAITIKKTEREAEPNGLDPEQVANLYGKVVQQIGVLRELERRNNGTAQGGSYGGLLARGEAWRSRLEDLAPH